MGLANHQPFATNAFYVTANASGTVKPYTGVIIIGKGPMLTVRQATTGDDPQRIYWSGPVGAQAGSGGSIRNGPTVAITLDYPAIARVAPGETLAAGDYASVNAQGQVILDVVTPSFVVQQSETDGAAGSSPAYCLIDRLATATPQEKLIRFKMKSHLPLGGKGKAVEIGTGVAYTEVGAQFPIKDPWSTPGSWRDDTGSGETAGSYMGWCLIPDNPEVASSGEFDGAFTGEPFREIVWMEQIATYINFTATSATTKDTETPANPWTVTATVDDWYQGKDPGDAFASYTIHDPQQMFPKVMDCSKGMARYNEQDHRYEIVNVNQMAFAATAVLGSDLCSTGTPTLTSVKAASFSPFGMAPTIETAANPKKLCGVAGAKIWLDYDSKWGNACSPAAFVEGEWIVKQVEHREIEVILDHRVVEVGSPPCCQHQVKRIKLCAMSCDEIESIPWEVVDGPTDCCQEQIIPGCCGCPDAPMSGTSVIDLTLTGALTGTVTLTQTAGGCVRWTGTLTSPGGPCASEFASSDFTLTCEADSANPIYIEATGGGAECAFRTGQFAPDIYDCGTPGDPGISGDITIPTRDIIAGDPLTPCACGAEIFIAFQERIP